MAGRKVKNDWFERKARRAVKNHRFVSVALPKKVRGQISAGRTEAFPTETDAEQFVKEVLSKNTTRKNTTSSRAHYWAFIPWYVVLSQARNSIAGLG